MRICCRQHGTSTVGIYHRHIDALFGGEIDWDLITTHAPDMIQVPLSIQVGVVMPSMSLRKLEPIWRSRLCRAFRTRPPNTHRFCSASSSANPSNYRRRNHQDRSYNDFLD